MRNVQGTGLWHVDSGSGRPLVLLHGWCMSSAVWEVQHVTFSGSCRVIAPDLPGHGRSPLPAGGFTLEGCVRELNALFRELDLHNAVLCGWSLGGMAALRSLPLLGARVAGLVLVGATPRFTNGEGYTLGLSTPDVEGMARKVERNLRRALSGFIERMFVEGEHESVESALRVREILDAVPLPETVTALEGLQVLARTDLRADLPRIDLPVLVINGDRDPICLPRASDYLAGAIRGARQSIFPGCGHAPFLTRADRFNRCLEEFMEVLPRCP